jgi:hypothetical protein
LWKKYIFCGKLASKLWKTLYLSGKNYLSIITLWKKTALFHKFSTRKNLESKKVRSFSTISTNDVEGRRKKEEGRRNSYIGLYLWI